MHTRSKSCQTYSTLTEYLDRASEDLLFDVITGHVGGESFQIGLPIALTAKQG